MWPCLSHPGGVYKYVWKTTWAACRRLSVSISSFLWQYLACWLACSFVHIQADELNGALVWCPAGLAVLHVLPLWTVSKGVAVSHQVDLVKSANRSDLCSWRWSASLLRSSYLRLISWLDVDVFSINVGVNILIWMDVQQHVQLQEGDKAAFLSF